MSERDIRRSMLVDAVVAAYISNHDVGPEELSGIVQAIGDSLDRVGAQEAAPAAMASVPEVAKATAAEVRRSITPDALVSFEDGKKYRMLKRHLTGLGMTPADYRRKWGLPNDYPMTAPSYAARRSEIAKRIGLGSKGRGQAAPEPVAEPVAAVKPANELQAAKAPKVQQAAKAPEAAKAPKAAKAPEPTEVPAPVATTQSEPVEAAQTPSLKDRIVKFANMIPGRKARAADTAEPRPGRGRPRKV